MRVDMNRKVCIGLRRGRDRKRPRRRQWHREQCKGTLQNTESMRLLWRGRLGWVDEPEIILATVTQIRIQLNREMATPTQSLPAHI
jgi:hypothetical protein